MESTEDEWPEQGVQVWESVAEVNNEGEWSNYKVDNYGIESTEVKEEEGDEEGGKTRKFKKGTIEYEYQIDKECKWEHWEMHK